MKIKYLIFVASVICATLFGGYIRDLAWRRDLVKVDLAEYATKTGEWRLRTITEIVDTGLILGKATPVKSN